MGLDISVSFDNAEDFLFDHEFEDDDKWRDKHELSRTFCNLMSRQHVVEGKPELDQIAEMARVDVSQLYLMLNYWTEDSIEDSLEFDDDIDEDDFRKNCEEQNKLLEGNIDLLIVDLAKLCAFLDLNHDLSEKVDDNGFDTLGKDYFKELNEEQTDSYVDNNFNQDLKNLIRMAEFGKRNGAKTIFFELM